MDLLLHLDPRGVATLTLNRPDRHNAFDDALIAAITAALEALGARADVRAVVLTGAGRSFSAGADVGWMQRMAGYSEAENLADAAALARMLHTLDRLPKPTLAVVNGSAYGGGVGLVACCDVAVASERATFALTEVKLGLTPATISPFVRRAIGARQARRFFTTAEPIGALRARELGLVHEVAAPSELHAVRDRIVDAWLAGAPGAQADAKALTFLSGDPDALAAETSRRIAARRVSAEGREGLAAFLAKRAPSWQAP